jgi:hypothetical protein
MRTVAQLVIPVIACCILAAGHLFAQTAPQPENTAAACQDGLDNDGDTFVHCKDQDCSLFVFCQQQQPVVTVMMRAERIMTRTPAISSVLPMERVLE